MSSRYALTDDVREAFPDEREALRGLARAVDGLVSNLLGDIGRDLGWKNELSLSAVLELRDTWLPLARERLGVGVHDPEPVGDGS